MFRKGKEDFEEMDVDEVIDRAHRIGPKKSTNEQQQTTCHNALHHMRALHCRAYRARKTASNGMFHLVLTKKELTQPCQFNAEATQISLYCCGRKMSNACSNNGQVCVSIIS